MSAVAPGHEVVTKRELNQHTAQVLSRVSPDHFVIVSERGRPRWQIGAYTPARSGLALLESLGQYSPPSPRPAPWPDDPGGRKYNSAELDAMLEEMRGEN